jgi:hypothetical protein
MQWRHFEVGLQFRYLSYLKIAINGYMAEWFLTIITMCLFEPCTYCTLALTLFQLFVRIASLSRFNPILNLKIRRILKRRAQRNAEIVSGASNEGWTLVLDEGS